MVCARQSAPTSCSSPVTEVEAAWSWTDPVIDQWIRKGSKPAKYEPGSSGPEDSLMLMHKDGRKWREIS